MLRSQVRSQVCVRQVCHTSRGRAKWKGAGLCFLWGIPGADQSGVLLFVILKNMQHHLKSDC